MECGGSRPKLNRVLFIVGRSWRGNTGMLSVSWKEFI